MLSGSSCSCTAGAGRDLERAAPDPHEDADVALHLDVLVKGVLHFEDQPGPCDDGLLLEVLGLLDQRAHAVGERDLLLLLLYELLEVRPDPLQILLQIVHRGAQLLHQLVLHLLGLLRVEHPVAHR